MSLPQIEDFSYQSLVDTVLKKKSYKNSSISAPNCNSVKNKINKNRWKENKKNRRSLIFLLIKNNMLSGIEGKKGKY